jgi:hypothetical protein
VVSGRVSRRAGRRLTALPDEKVLAIYNAMRPQASTKQELLDIAEELERDYSAPLCGRLAARDLQISRWTTKPRPCVGVGRRLSRARRRRRRLRSAGALSVVRASGVEVGHDVSGALGDVDGGGVDVVVDGQHRPADRGLHLLRP